MNKKQYVIGIMSGTSLDGMDLVYVVFEKTTNYSFEILEKETIAYPKYWEDTLRNAFYETESKLRKLSLSYGEYIAEQVLLFKNKYDIKKVDFIASHGHTIFHKPEEGYTLQIGDGHTIASITNSKVVADFRTQDVALGGQGAPLVPIGDALLFGDYDACINLGGFANISYQESSKRIAFDVCAVNTVLNYYAEKLGKPYDDAGCIAASGIVNNDLLEALENLEYYTLPAPKSLGFEFVKKELAPIFNRHTLPIKDILRTYVEHVALQIANTLRNKAFNSVLITGGGAYNTFMIERLQMHSNQEITIPSEDIVNFKESLIFAFLGLLRLDNQVNCLSSVTGASKDHSSGQIFNP